MELDKETLSKIIEMLDQQEGKHTANMTKPNKNTQEIKTAQEETSLNKTNGKQKQSKNYFVV